MSFDPAAEGWSPWPPSGFSGFTGPLWSRPEGEGWAYGVLADERHANNHGIVHGGMLVTLLDNTLGITVHRAVGNRPGVTMQLNTQFLSAAHPGDFLVGRGEILRLARSVAFVRGTVSVGDRLIVAGDGVWKLLAAPAAA